MEQNINLGDFVFSWYEFRTKIESFQEYMVIVHLVKIVNLIGEAIDFKVKLFNLEFIPINFISLKVPPAQF